MVNVSTAPVRTVPSGVSTDSLSMLTVPVAAVPTISNNRRLETIFAHAPDYVNREMVLPCVINQERSAVSPKISGTAVERLIRENLATIVTPATSRYLSKAQRAQLKILASPYECGRVLELDPEVQIDGKPYVVNLKGVGATTFARFRSAHNPWASHPNFGEEALRALSRFPFYKKVGLCSRSDAESERDNVKFFRARGLLTERVLGIFEIERMVDGFGTLRPTNYFQKFNIIGPRATPVILARAAHTNLRLFDLDMLVQTGRAAAVPAVIDYAKRTYGIVEKVSQPSTNQYFDWLARRILNQELPLIVRGVSLGTEKWQNLARNISLMGEELDLESFSSFPDRHCRSDHYIRQATNSFSCIESTLRSVGGILSKYGEAPIDFEQYAQTMIKHLDEALDESLLFPVYVHFTEEPTQSFRAFRDDLHRALYKKFDTQSLTGADEQGIARYGRILRERFRQLQ